MRALQALIPLAKYKSLTSAQLMEPDKHGGWEMGTWNFIMEITFISELLKNNLTEASKSEFYVFPEEDRLKILEHVKNKHKINEKGEYIIRKYETNEIKTLTGLEELKLTKLGFKLFCAMLEEPNLVWYGR